MLPEDIYGKKQKAVLMAMGWDPVRSKTIAERIGAKTVHATLRSLESKGLVLKISQGVWQRVSENTPGIRAQLAEKNTKLEHLHHRLLTSQKETAETKDALKMLETAIERRFIAMAKQYAPQTRGVRVEGITGAVEVTACDGWGYPLVQWVFAPTSKVSRFEACLLALGKEPDFEWPQHRVERCP